MRPWVRPWSSALYAPTSRMSTGKASSIDEFSSSAEPRHSYRRRPTDNPRCLLLRSPGRHPSCIESQPCLYGFAYLAERYHKRTHREMVDYRDCDHKNGLWPSSRARRRESAFCIYSCHTRSVIACNSAAGRSAGRLDASSTAPSGTGRQSLPSGNRRALEESEGVTHGHVSRALRLRVGNARLLTPTTYCAAGNGFSRWAQGPADTELRALGLSLRRARLECRASAYAPEASIASSPAGWLLHWDRRRSNWFV